MEYEQFILTETNECNCGDSVRIALIMVALIELVVTCYGICKTNRRVYQLERENESLKKRVIRNIDNAFTNIMKNGNDYENDHED